MDFTLLTGGDWLRPFAIARAHLAKLPFPIYLWPVVGGWCWCFLETDRMLTLCGKSVQHSMSQLHSVFQLLQSAHPTGLCFQLVICRLSH